METKWLAIMMIGIMAVSMGALAVEKYTQGQCKLAYAQSTKTADEILKLCGK
jgi:hypothetical protein